MSFNGLLTLSGVTQDIEPIHNLIHVRERSDTCHWQILESTCFLLGGQGVLPAITGHSRTQKPALMGASDPGLPARCRLSAVLYV